jgi:hypothetical protein
MIKYLKIVSLIFLMSCDGYYLGKDNYFRYEIKNDNAQNLTLNTYKLSRFVSKIQIKANSSYVNKIHVRDMNGVDGFFYPKEEPDSIVVEFEDKKKVTYSYITGRFSNVQNFTSFNYKQNKSKRWGIYLDDVRIINEEDYKLAK